MRSKIAFFRCEVCGNLVELINNGGGELVCCGKPMVKLDPNTFDASTEKHVPAAERKDGKIYVTVGSVEHPMTEEHYIEWIAVVSDDGIERIELSPGNEPKAVFRDRNNVDVYAYCNLHGLWKSSLE
ncbi:MAG TPA: desulfoferrodoxin [Ruminiclostridium sp.]|jgi:superoxide reductase|uniref:Desulfoferrodoxin n=1 Tax=Acetivibrio saccincola TaxID=1677857 RepID=A0A2K9E6H0_9FIRM|nr:desulfoferrodoxin [Acetivibrio saccincola]HAA42907.1 desulfoferrodoxin [Ruminiclostridium sp.]AUG58969.1 Desulfoferrodoxin [Acetivibrio saccincola]NLW27957.1 desulfoferrodoxin [Acetivibrio saccincola]PQQ65953.1 desulfoferrodoxin [Acetivibrio saccincola]HOA96622.1 desulfoferrodoxin [Acetivibrio saccincola]